MALHIQVRPSKGKLKDENTFNSLYWSLKPLIPWMSVIGLPLPPLKSRPPKWTYYIVRTFGQLVVSTIHVWLAIHVILYATHVSEAYTNGISTAVLSCLFISDGCNFGLYTIAGYGFLNYITRPTSWPKIANCSKKLDDNLAFYHIYPKCRRTLIRLMLYIALSVCCDF